jgi:hypothetical protein
MQLIHCGGLGFEEERKNRLMFWWVERDLEEREREIIRSNKVVGGLLLPHIKLQKIVFSYWCGGLWEEWYVQYIGKKKVRNVIKLKIVYFVTFMCHNRIVYLCLSKIKWKRGSWKILIKYRKEQVISNKNL